MRAIRRSIDAARREEASRALTRRLLARPEIAASERVLTCLSFGDEIDTWRLVDALLDRGQRVLVPRAGAARRLSVHAYPCPLETLDMGLRQPRPDVPALDDTAIDRIGCALVLGLAFDRDGHRLGYGAGYFDRFLAGRAFPIIGVTFEEQVIDRVPVEPHDVPMTSVISDR